MADMTLKVKGQQPAKPPRHVLIAGHKIHFKLVQSVLWTLIVTSLTVAMWAAVYYVVTQKGWFGFTKAQWDGLFRYSWWSNYRHGLRDVGEPVAAAMVVHSFIIGSWKKHQARESGLKLARHVLIAVVSAFVMIIAGVTIIDYAIPHSVTGRTVSTVVAGTLSYSFVIAFAFSFIVVHLVKFAWAPVGNAISLGITEIAVRRANGKLPVWVRLPLAPPAMRERFAWVQQHTPVGEMETGRLARWLVALAALVYVALAAYGEYILHVVAKH